MSPFSFSIVQVVFDLVLFGFDLNRKWECLRILLFEGNSMKLLLFELKNSNKKAKLWKNCRKMMIYLFQNSFFFRLGNFLMVLWFLYFNWNSKSLQIVIGSFFWLFVPEKSFCVNYSSFNKICPSVTISMSCHFGVISHQNNWKHRIWIFFFSLNKSEIIFNIWYSLYSEICCVHGVFAKKGFLLVRF